MCFGGERGVGTHNPRDSCLEDVTLPYGICSGQRQVRRRGEGIVYKRQAGWKSVKVWIDENLTSPSSAFWIAVLWKHTLFGGSEKSPDLLYRTHLFRDSHW